MAPSLSHWAVLAGAFFASSADMNPNTSTSRPTFPLKAFAIVLLLAFLGGIGAYFYGLSQGRAALAAQRTQFMGQIERATGEAQEAKNEMTAANNRVRLLNAQNGLYRAAIALDRRNFGIANTALQGATKSLGQVKESSWIELSQVQSLAAALQKTDINVAVNLETQRERILGFAAQMDEMIAPDPPSQAAPNGTNANSLAPDGGTPAPDGLTQLEEENAASSESEISNSATGNAVR